MEILNWARSDLGLSALVEFQRHITAPTGRPGLLRDFLWACTQASRREHRLLRRMIQRDRTKFHRRGSAGWNPMSMLKTPDLKMLDHSGIVSNCWTGALAQLGVARANALQSRTSQGADADAARGRALAAYKISSSSGRTPPRHPHPEANQSGVREVAIVDANFSGYCVSARPSRPGELHPEPLTDPCLTVASHTARATQ